MTYWLILIVLAVLILLTIIITIVTIVKERKEYKQFELEADYDDRPKRKGNRPAAPRSKKEEKLRWKIILQDTDTEEEYTYIFYDTVGMGRTTKDVAYEEFLSLPHDRKVSKVHCAIIRNRDKLYLKDEGSRNYTFLNGRRVQKPIVIQRDDIISLGNTDLEIVRILRESK